MVTTSQYRLSFIAGGSGRFVSTILYGLLYDPCPIEYLYGSAHEFQGNNLPSVAFLWPPEWDWHVVPEKWDSSLRYIIIRIRGSDIPELAYNNVHKNMLWNIGRKERGLIYREHAVESFNEIYAETFGSPWDKGSIQNLTDLELRGIEKTMTKWMSRGISNDGRDKSFLNPQVPEGVDHLIINYSDIFLPQGPDSWLVLDQIIKYTNVTYVDPQVRDNYRRYVEYRNSKLDLIGTV